MEIRNTRTNFGTTTRLGDKPRGFSGYKTTQDPCLNRGNQVERSPTPPAKAGRA